MQVVVKTPRTKIKMEGEIPLEVVESINRAFSKSIKIYNDNGEEIVLATETDWYKKIKKNTSAGDVIKIYRSNLGYS